MKKAFLAPQSYQEKRITKNATQSQLQRITGEEEKVKGNIEATTEKQRLI